MPTNGEEDDVGTVGSCIPVTVESQVPYRATVNRKKLHLQQQRQHHGHQESIRKEEIKRRMDSWPWRELSLSCCWRLTMAKGVSLYEWWEVALDHGTILWTIQ